VRWLKPGGDGNGGKRGGQDATHRQFLRGDCALVVVKFRAIFSSRESSTDFRPMQLLLGHRKVV